MIKLQNNIIIFTKQYKCFCSMYYKQKLTMPLSVVIVEKNGDLKSLNIKDYKEEELYKKCGFKSKEGFACHAKWPLKIDGQKYLVELYGKDDGRANNENKYDFPPPVDNKLFFGACVLVGYLRDDTGDKSLFSLSVALWQKMYEKLFGGFEDLTSAQQQEDDDEEDELDNVSSKKKTKVGGYLKDGFVVDDADNSDDEDEDASYSGSNSSDTGTAVSGNNGLQDEDELCIEDVGSELSEESYDYSDDE